MLAEERRFRICEILSRQRTVSATELKDTLMVTAATIRRDLCALEQEGLLVRSHGGAVSKSSSTSFQPSYEALGRANQTEKQAIAVEAAKLIFDGETVFLGRQHNRLPACYASTTEKPSDSCHELATDCLPASAGGKYKRHVYGRRSTARNFLSFRAVGAAIGERNSSR